MNEQDSPVVRSRRRRADDGSIEGLPLQLMIIGLIAGLGSAIIVGWISSIEPPRFVGQVEFDPQYLTPGDDDADGIFVQTVKTLSVRVRDTAGSPIPGAFVLLEGEAIDNEHHRVFGTTDSDGLLLIENLRIKLLRDAPSAILVTVSGQELAGKFETELIVIPI